MRVRTVVLLAFLSAARLGAAPSSRAQERDPGQSAGFAALFNGKDLSGWHGMPHFDPRKLAAMGEKERAGQVAAWTEDARKHWSVRDGAVVNDGHGPYLTTDKDYGDIELLIEYKTVPKADSGIYLRGTPQVQIWDSHQGRGATCGTSAPTRGRAASGITHPGGPWQGPARPGRQAARRVEPASRSSRSERGRPSISMTSSSSMVRSWRTTSIARSPLFARGPIQLQTHGGEIQLAEHLHS